MVGGAYIQDRNICASKNVGGEAWRDVHCVYAGYYGTKIVLVRHLFILTKLFN